jgi:hypothetical protein
VNHGNTSAVREESGIEREARNAQIQARSAQGRQRKASESEEPEASHRDRSLGSAQEGREGPAKEEQLTQALFEKAHVKAQLREETPLAFATLEEPRQCGDHALVAFAKQRGEDVLADSLAPQVITAVASRVRGSVEVYPVIVATAGDVIPSASDALATKPKAAGQTAEVDTASGVEFDL